jgi:hypothetical protein
MVCTSLELISVANWRPFLVIIEQPFTIDMKCLIRKYHSSMFFFGYPVSEIQNQNHGHGLLIPSLFRTSPFRVVSNSNVSIDWGWVCNLHNHWQIDSFRKGEISFKPYWRKKNTHIKIVSTPSESAAITVCLVRRECIPGFAASSLWACANNFVPDVWKPLVCFAYHSFKCTRGLVLHYTHR